MALRELQTEADIAHMVRTFYERVYQDERLGPIFIEVAGVHFEEHLQTMNRFWEAVLLGKAGFRGNPHAKHRNLHQKIPLTSALFAHWLELFEENLNASFQGGLATKALLAAHTIARNLEASVTHSEPIDEFAYRQRLSVNSLQ